MDEWQPIPGFGRYSISAQGEIRNRYGYVLQTNCPEHAYVRVGLRDDRGCIQSCAVHRLVAQMFVANDNPRVKIYVNHKDRNKRNNAATNLEWVSASENRKHCVESGIQPSNRLAATIVWLDHNGVVIDEFPNQQAAAEALNIHQATVSNILKGKVIRKQKGSSILAEHPDHPPIQFINGTAAAAHFKSCKSRISIAMSKGVITTRGPLKGWTFSRLDDVHPVLKLKLDVYDVLLNEEWCDMPGNDTYQVSSSGKVYNKCKQKLVWGASDGRYLRVQLRINGETKHFAIHRLVAQCFVANPDDKPCVNHIDGDKLNNNAANLEWCTQQENMQHAAAKGRFKDRVSQWNEYQRNRAK